MSTKDHEPEGSVGAEPGASPEIGTLASSLKSMSASEAPDPWDLLGLRAEDLTDAERFRAQRMVESDPKAAEERFSAVTLASTLKNLPNPQTALTAAAVFEQARVRRNPALRWPVALALGVALGVLATAGWQQVPEPEPVAPVGITQVVEHSVDLEAVALGVDGVRTLQQDDVVHAGDNVVFRMHGEGPGAVLLTEMDGAGYDRIVFPAVPVNTDEGKSGVYLAYRPDYGLGMKSYTAWICPAHLTKPDPKRCKADALTLTWRQ